METKKKKKEIKKEKTGAWNIRGERGRKGRRIKNEVKQKIKENSEKRNNKKCGKAERKIESKKKYSNKKEMKMK